MKISIFVDLQCKSIYSAITSETTVYGVRFVEPNPFLRSGSAGISRLGRLLVFIHRPSRASLNKSGF